MLYHFGSFNKIVILTIFGTYQGCPQTRTHKDAVPTPQISKERHTC